MFHIGDIGLKVSYQIVLSRVWTLLGMFVVVDRFEISWKPDERKLEQIFAR